MSHEEIAKALGKNVGAASPLMCPLCSPDCLPEGQPMSSYGDMEYILFCPHCDLTVELTITDVPY